MSDRTRLPKGWRLDTFPKNDGAGVVWVLFRGLDDGRMCAVAGRDADSEGEAVEAARKVVEAASEPPTSPAWMVEVAREAGAQHHENHGLPETAARMRVGECDEYSDLIVSALALCLALERGHVVEPREWTQEDLEQALKAAWDCGAIASEMAMIWVRRGDRDVAGRFMAAKAHDVPLILSRLPTREA